MRAPITSLWCMAAIGVVLLVGCPGGDARPFAAGPYAKLRIGDFDLLVARSPEQILHGLMHVPAIPSRRGMVFVLPEGARAAFWMKDCLVPMDMVFIGIRGEVQGVQTAWPAPQAAPSDQIPLYGYQGVYPGTETYRRAPKPEATALVVEVRQGEGRSFAEAWRPEFLHLAAKQSEGRMVNGF